LRRKERERKKKEKGWAVGEKRGKKEKKDETRVSDLSESWIAGNWTTHNSPLTYHPIH